MGLFRKKSENINIQADTVQIDSSVNTNSKSLVEIEPHQQARREVVEKTKEVNDHLKELLVENGFTIKIYLAAGGNNPQAKKGTKSK